MTSHGARVVLLIGFLGAAAARADGTEAPAGPGSLTLTLRSVRASYVMYEPVLLRFEIRNPTQNSITTSDLEYHWTTALRFRISGPDGRRTEYSTRGAIICGVLMEKSYPPGSVLIRRAAIDWKGAEYVFDIPGSYEIRAQVGLSDPPKGVTIESSPITVEMHEPRGADAKMLEALPTRDDMMKLLRGGASGYCRDKDIGICGDEIAAICRKHDKARYAPALMLDLASTTAYSGDKQSGDGYRKRVALLEEILSRWPADPIAPEAMAVLAPLYVPLGRYPEGLELVKRLRTEYPEDPEPSERAEITLLHAAGMR